MSLRRGDEGFYIMPTGAYLDASDEPVFVPADGDVPEKASSEYRVHREVYLATRYAAIIHAHPPYTVAASLNLDEIVPIDSEGEMFCPRIPVVTGMPGTDELARNVAGGLGTAHVVVARGHGTFAGGRTLDEAYLFTSLAEHACRVLALNGLFRK